MINSKKMILELFETSNTWIYGPYPSSEIGWKLHVSISKDSITKFIDVAWSLGFFDELKKWGVGWKIASKSVARDLEISETQRGKTIVFYVPESSRDVIPKIVATIERIIRDYGLKYEPHPKYDAGIGMLGCIGIRWSNFYGYSIPVPPEYRSNLERWLPKEFVSSLKSTRNDITHIPDDVLRYHPVPPWKERELEELRKTLERLERKEEAPSLKSTPQNQPPHSKEELRYASRFDLMGESREKYIGSIVAVKVGEPDKYVPARIVGFPSDAYYIEVEFLEGPEKGKKRNVPIVSISRTPEEKLKKRSYTQTSSKEEEQYANLEEIKEIIKGLREARREGKPYEIIENYLRRERQLVGRYLITRRGEKVEIRGVGTEGITVKFLEGPYKDYYITFPVLNIEDLEKTFTTPSQFKEKRERNYKITFYFLPVLLSAFTLSILSLFNLPKISLFVVSRGSVVGIIFLLLTTIILIFIRLKKKL